MAPPKSRMIGSKQRRIAAKNGRYLRLSLELLIKEGADGASVPALGVRKIAVEREIALGKGGACQGRCLGASNGHVEDGQVEKADLLVMVLDGSIR